MPQPALSPRRLAPILRLALFCFTLHLITSAYAQEIPHEPNAKFIVVLNITRDEAVDSWIAFYKLHQKIIESFPVSNNTDQDNKALICYLFRPPVPILSPTPPTEKKIPDKVGVRSCPSSDLESIPNVSKLIVNLTDNNANIIFNSIFTKTKYNRALLVSISEKKSDGSFKMRPPFFRQAIPPQDRYGTEEPCAFSNTNDTQSIVTKKCDTTLQVRLGLKDPMVALPSSKFKILIDEQLITKKDKISVAEGTHTARWASRLFEKDADRFTVLYGDEHTIRLNKENAPRVSLRAKIGFSLLSGAVAVLAIGVPLLVTSCDELPNSESTYRCISRNTKFDGVGWSLAGAGTALGMVGTVLLALP